MDHDIDCSGCGRTVARTDDAELVRKIENANILCPTCDEASDDTDTNEGDEK